MVISNMKYHRIYETKNIVDFDRTRKLCKSAEYIRIGEHICFDSYLDSDSDSGYFGIEEPDTHNGLINKKDKKVYDEIMCKLNEIKRIKNETVKVK